MFIGIEGIARKVTGAHIGVDGVARRVKKAYVGVDGVARLAWEAGGRVRAYLYNRAKLPEPPKWDAAAAPEAVIVKNDKSTTSDTYFYCGKDMLRVSDIATGIRRPYAGYILTDSGWSKTDYWLGITLTQDILWANYDVYYRDDLEDAALAGTLCLAASEPVPLCSYNGMELPKLPEWDTTEYPYACIAKLKQGSYMFGASKSAVLISYKEGSGMRCDWEPPSLQSSYIPLYEFNGNTYGDYRWKSLQYEENTCGGGYFNDITMWANYDVVYNGEVIVTASDPQPVYL